MVEKTHADGRVSDAASSRERTDVDEAYVALRKMAKWLVSRGFATPADAEDQLQYTMLRLVESGVRRIDPSYAREAFRNAGRDLHRRRTADKRGGDVTHVDLDEAQHSGTSDAQSPEALLRGREDVAAVIAAIRSLPKSQRQVVLLLSSGLTPAEVAQRLGTTDHAVRARHRRALIALRARLESQ